LSITLSEKDLETLLSFFDELIEVSDKARGLLAGRFAFNKPEKVQPATSTTSVDVSRAVFKKKGGAEAGPKDQWGWAWARAQNGSYHDESRALVQYLEQYGEMTQGGFTYSLSKDGKFLNRKKV